MNTQDVEFLQVGAFYKFDYELAGKGNKLPWWECIKITQGWGTFQRLGKDHAGTPRMYSTTVEVAYAPKCMKKRPYINRIYLDPNRIGDYEVGLFGTYMRLKVIEDGGDCSNLIIVDFDKDGKLQEINFKR